MGIVNPGVAVGAHQDAFIHFGPDGLETAV